MFRLGIDPEKLYRATFICQDGLCCCHMALISFRLFRKNLGNLRYVLGKWFTAPPGKKFPVRLWWPHPIIHLTFSSKFRLIQVLMYAHFMKRQRAKFIGKNKTYWLKKSISHNGKWETIRLLSAITKTLQRIEDLAFSLIYHVKKPNFTDCNIRKEHRFYKLN